jgi:hypothetical protein
MDDLEVAEKDDAMVDTMALVRVDY